MTNDFVIRKLIILFNLSVHLFPSVLTDGYICISKQKTTLAAFAFYVAKTKELSCCFLLPFTKVKGKWSFNIDYLILFISSFIPACFSRRMHTPQNKKRFFWRNPLDSRICFCVVKARICFMVPLISFSNLPVFLYNPGIFEFIILPQLISFFFCFNSVDKQFF